MKLGYMEPVHPLDLPIAPYMYYSPNLVVPIHAARVGARAFPFANRNRRASGVASPRPARARPRPRAAPARRVPGAAPHPGSASGPARGGRGRRGGGTRDGRGTTRRGGKVAQAGGGKRAGSSTGSGRGRRDTPGLCRDVRALCHFELSLTRHEANTHRRRTGSTRGFDALSTAVLGCGIRAVVRGERKW